VYCEDYAGYFTIILSFLAFHFCSAYFIYLISCIFALFSQIDDPLTFEEVVKDDVWEQAVDEEINCTKNNQTWKSIDVPEDKDVISVKWIYKTKKNVDGNVGT
jgi:hypothetical protein